MIRVITPKLYIATVLTPGFYSYLQGYFHDIYVWSPTLHSDEKWDYIRKRPLRTENVELKKFLEKKKGGDNPVVGGYTVADTSNKKFDPLIPDDCFRTEYDEETLQTWMTNQMKAIEMIEKLGGTKHLADRTLHIFDDLVGSALFSSTRRSPFKMLNTNHRHHSCSILLVSQVNPSPLQVVVGVRIAVGPPVPVSRSAGVLAGARETAGGFARQTQRMHRVPQTDIGCDVFSLQRELIHPFHFCLFSGVQRNPKNRPHQLHGSDLFRNPQRERGEGVVRGKSRGHETGPVGSSVSVLRGGRVQFLLRQLQAAQTVAYDAEL